MEINKKYLKGKQDKEVEAVLQDRSSTQVHQLYTQPCHNTINVLITVIQELTALQKSDNSTDEDPPVVINDSPLHSHPQTPQGDEDQLQWLEEPDTLEQHDGDTNEEEKTSLASHSNVSVVSKESVKSTSSRVSVASSRSSVHSAVSKTSSQSGKSGKDILPDHSDPSSSSHSLREADFELPASSEHEKPHYTSLASNLSTDGLALSKERILSDIEPGETADTDYNYEDDVFEESEELGHEEIVHEPKSQHSKDTDLVTEMSPSPSSESEIDKGPDEETPTPASNTGDHQDKIPSNDANASTSTTRDHQDNITSDDADTSTSAAKDHQDKIPSNDANASTSTTKDHQDSITNDDADTSTSADKDLQDKIPSNASTSNTEEHQKSTVSTSAAEDHQDSIESNTSAGITEEDQDNVQHSGTNDSTSNSEDCQDKIQNPLSNDAGKDDSSEPENDANAVQEPNEEESSEYMNKVVQESVQHSDKESSIAEEEVQAEDDSSEAIVHNHLPSSSNVKDAQSESKDTPVTQEKLTPQGILLTRNRRKSSQLTVSFESDAQMTKMDKRSSKDLSASLTIEEATKMLQKSQSNVSLGSLLYEKESDAASSVDLSGSDDEDIPDLEQKISDLIDSRDKSEQKENVETAVPVVETEGESTEQPSQELTGEGEGIRSSQSDMVEDREGKETFAEAAGQGDEADDEGETQDHQQEQENSEPTPVPAESVSIDDTGSVKSGLSSSSSKSSLTSVSSQSSHS